MFDKIKDIFNNKEKKKENMITFLIILVITLIIINKILQTPNVESKDDIEKEAYLATNCEETIKEDDIETRLENILDTLKGVSNVSVMLTYNESSSIVPIYNINESTTKTDKDESISLEKEVIVDSESKIITEKIVNPKIEGAIITAKGVSDPTVKGNVISAVEAVTGLMTHEIQVFETGD